MHRKSYSSTLCEPPPSSDSYKRRTIGSNSGFSPANANPRWRLLDGIAPSDANAILAAAKPRHFLTNSIIVNQGDPANHLFLLTKGRARFFFNTHDGRKVLLLWLTPGEIFGAAALLPATSGYLVSAESLKDSDTLVWDRVTVRGLAAKYPKLVENALMVASDYLAFYLATHNALVSCAPRERLGRLLVCLAGTIGEKGLDGFEFDATNEELAGATNLTPFTVSRLLSEWQRDQAVGKRRGKILLKSPERLCEHMD